MGFYKLFNEKTNRAIFQVCVVAVIFSLASKDDFPLALSVYTDKVFDPYMIHVHVRYEVFRRTKPSSP